MNKENFDESQQKVIKSKAKKLIVEAPAGFGKTTTMVGLINYWISKKIIKNNQKVLCLTYTISAANRMKKSLGEDNTFFATNFHGFCRRVLSLYGKKVNIPSSNEFTTLICVDTRNVKGLISDKEYEVLNKFDSLVKSGALNLKSIKQRLRGYNNIIRNIIKSEKKLTYNSILTFAIELLLDNPNIRNFYKKFYTCLCVDEFQDTNILGLLLIKLIESDRIVLFGDQMQQIYSFLGAIPNIFDRLLETEPYEYVRLQHNYRFSSNRDMLLLDKNIRAFRDNMNFNQSFEKSNLNFILGDTVEEEASKIVEWINTQKGNSAILVNQDTYTSVKLKELLKNKNIDFFDATFKETDLDFIKFQNDCLVIFQQLYQINSINKLTKKKLFVNVRKIKYNESYYQLFEAFVNHVIHENEPDYRNNIIKDILVSNSLRNYLNTINTKIIYSTIHGSKGLEWDNVVIANFNQNEFPNYPQILDMELAEGENLFSANKEGLRKLLNIFYVAFSRAKKNILVAGSNIIYSKNRIKTGNISCISSLPFIKLRRVDCDNSN